MAQRRRRFLTGIGGLGPILCGGSGGGRVSPGAPSTSTSAGAGTTGASSAVTRSTAPTRTTTDPTHATSAQPVLAIQDGPASPISPDNDRYYNQVEHLVCSEAAQQQPSPADPEPGLYAALGQVCLAAQHAGRPLSWSAVS